MICRNNKAILAVQVSYDISSDKTRKREIAGLLLAAKKTGCENLLLLTDHDEDDITCDGFSISVRPVFEYVLS